MSSSFMARRAGLVLLLVALILYLLTLDNGLRPGELAGGDLITHQYAQVQARPSNAPGYPVYTLGGWIWFHGLRALLGPSSNPIAILSTYSVLWALVALTLLYQLMLQVTGNWLLSLLSGAFYAVTYFFWFYATSTEQYASAVAHTLAILLLALLWDQRQQDRPGSSDANGAGQNTLLALAFLSGLTLAHMVTVALILPPLAWFILRRRPDLLHRPRLIAGLAGLFLLPLLAYAYVYVRGAQHPEWWGVGQWPSTWAWFRDFLSTQQGRGELTWSVQPLWTAEFPSLIWRELTWIVLAGGLAGVAMLGRRRGMLLGGTLLFYLAFSFVDRLGNWYQVIMPAYALLVLGFAGAMQEVWRRLGDRAVPQMGRWLLVAGLVGLVVWRAATNLPLANHRNQPDDTGLLPGQAILADMPAAGAAVLGVYTETLSLRYLTDIWGLRDDVEAVDSATAQRILATGERPLYVTDSAVSILWQEVSAAARLSSAGGTLIAVSAQPATDIPPHAIRAQLMAGSGLQLAAYHVEQQTTDNEEPRLWVRLYWQALGQVETDWSVSVRPTGAGQELRGIDGGILQQDLSSPVHGAYPTSRWLPGEIVADDYYVSLPSEQVSDGVRIVIYRLADGAFQDLAVLDLPVAGQ